MHLKGIYYSKYIAIVDTGLQWSFSEPSSDDREKVDGKVYTWKIMGTKFSK